MKMYGLTLECLIYGDYVFHFKFLGCETVVGLIALASLIDASPTLQVFFDCLEQDGGSAIDWHLSNYLPSTVFGSFGEIELTLYSYDEFTKLWISMEIEGKQVALEFN